jgi:hypothetical protein
MIETFVFSNVKYARGQYDSQESITFTIDGNNMSVANGSVGNRHYDDLMRQVNAGTLTIADAD